jgi:hypothetical protein
MEGFKKTISGFFNKIETAFEFIGKIISKTVLVIREIIKFFKDFKLKDLFSQLLEKSKEMWDSIKN